MGKQTSAPRVCLLGAAPTTGNLGVTALCFSILDALLCRIPNLEITVFDYKAGNDRTMSYNGHTVLLRGSVMGRRAYQSENLWNMRIAGKLGGFWNRSMRSLRDADAIIDMSGGDSFTDLYGPRLFRGNTMRKGIAIRSGTPVILGPQTYGPFRTERTNRIASVLVRGASMAWARDADSFAVLKGLLQGSFEPERHRLGVDCAFLLPAKDPGDLLPEAVRSWIGVEKADRAVPVLGINVSGLLANDSVAAHEQFGFRARYCDIVNGLAGRLLTKTRANIVLVPHVEPTGKETESDVKACAQVLSGVASKYAARVQVVPAMKDPREIKWVISRFDWFCGTRMHSAIAGLSSNVPTTAIAYSPKTRGVFATSGVADAVLDPRELDTKESLDGLWSWWERRAELESTLKAGVSGVKRQAEAQMDAIADACLRARQDRSRI